MKYILKGKNLPFVLTTEEEENIIDFFKSIYSEYCYYKLSYNYDNEDHEIIIIGVVEFKQAITEVVSDNIFRRVNKPKESKEELIFELEKIEI